VATTEIHQPFNCFRGRAILSGDALLQQFPEQTGDAGVVARSLDSGPLSHVFFKGYSYVS